MLMRFGVILIAAATVQGCAQTPSISEDDVSAVLSKAVLAAAKEVPRTFCLDPQLKPGSVIWSDKPGADGWAVSANKPNRKYRRLPSPELATIPVSAQKAFSSASAARDCHHTLDFNQPEFVEVRTPDETYIETTVFFSDPCPICGAGYAVEMTKRAGKPWEVVSPGVVQIWVS
jgi:hypothetical protein